MILEWPLHKLVRTFNRYFDDEREQMPPEAVTRGARLKAHLYTLTSPAALRSPAVRASTVKAIDEFVAAHAAPINGARPIGLAATRGETDEPLSCET